MSKFTTHKLEEIADVQTGPFGSQLHMSDYKKEGTPIITVEHLGENRIIHKNLPLVGDEDKIRLKKYTLKEGDIVFSRVGSVDRCAYVSAKEDDWMFSGRLLRVRTNEKVDSRFLSYYFNQESFKEYIRRIAVGATMPSINTTILSEVEIILPPLKEQKTIAEILSSLDEKIDLLNRQNKILEEMAESIFRQWFVEEADENWNVETLSNIIELKRGISYSSATLGEIDNGVPMHSLNSIDVNGSYKYEGIKYYKGDVKIDKRLSPGDLLIINTDITPDNRIIGWPIFVPDQFQESVCTHHLYATTLIDNRVSKFYLYFLLRYRDYREALANASNGTTVSMLSKEAIGNIEIKIPPISKREKFEAYATDILNKQSQNQNQIKTLSNLRNVLLPKIISGEAALNN
jgi:type I restriction enzyme S subunit